MIWLFYLFQVMVIAGVIFIVMIQKNGEGLFTNSKIFGVRGRSNVIIKITYVLGTLFLINSMILGILYKKRYAAEMIKETKEKTVKPKVANTDKISAKKAEK